jgi:hypothetical protein
MIDTIGHSAAQQSNRVLEGETVGAPVCSVFAGSNGAVHMQ